MKVSFGIVTLNRPAVLQNLLTSFNLFDINLEHEVVIFDNGSTGPETNAVIEGFASTYKRGSVKTIFSSHNVGFPAAWNMLEQAMRGEYRVMLQDDTIWHKCTPRVQFEHLINYMEQYNYRIMSICSEGESKSAPWLEIYSDWPHIEHISLRRTIGDYQCYPRKFKSLHDQGGAFEAVFNDQLRDAGIKIAIYPRLVATLQRNESIYQTLIHKVGNFPIADQDKMWDDPSMLDKLNVERWKA